MAAQAQTGDVSRDSTTGKPDRRVTLDPRAAVLDALGASCQTAPHGTSKEAADGCLAAWRRIMTAPAEPANTYESPFEGGRIPSLDGLRGISMMLVLLGHMGGTRNFIHTDLPIGDYAHLGVRVFFVMSGFLISSLLFDEIHKTKGVSLKLFYMRRTFRIFPAFYTYMLVLAITVGLGVQHVSRHDFAFAVSYAINFVPQKAWLVGHTWSLAVEEQFYLLWPAVLWLLGRTKGLWVAAATVLAVPLIRVGWYYLLPQYELLIGEAFPTVADAIAVGCLLAGIRGWLWRQEHYKRFLMSPAVWLVPLTFIAVNAQPFFMARWLLGETIMNVLIAVFIDRMIRRPDDLFGRFLNSRTMIFIGVLSYSLYLWQQPFLNRKSVDWWAAFPQNICFVFAAALASHYLIEKPFLRLRRKVDVLLAPAKKATPQSVPG